MPRPNKNVTWYGPTGSLSSTGSSSSGTAKAGSIVETYSGVSRRKPKGWKNPTAYSFSSNSVRSAYGTVISGQHKGFYNGSYNPIESWQMYYGYRPNINEDDAFTVAMSDAKANDDLGIANASLIAALGALKSSKINLGVAYAERKLTAQLIGSTATRLAKAGTQLKRRETRNAMRTLGISNRKAAPIGKNFAGLWLEMQYGWKPLLSDVYGSAEALASRDRSDWRVTAKGFKTVRDSGYRFIQTGYGNAGYFGSARSVKRAMTRIDAIPANGALISLASLGVTNPLLIAWERVPFSFVVDWIYPVGNWLNTLDSQLGYRDITSSTSYLLKVDWQAGGVSGSTDSNGRYTNSNWTASRSQRKLVRSVQSGLIIPRLPRIKNPASMTHMANALALLRQVFS